MFTRSFRSSLNRRHVDFPLIPTHIKNTHMRNKHECQSKNKNNVRNTQQQLRREFNSNVIRTRLAIVKNINNTNVPCNCLINVISSERTSKKIYRRFVIESNDRF